MRIDAPTFVRKSGQFLQSQVNFLAKFTSWLFQKMLFETRSPPLSLFVAILAALFSQFSLNIIRTVAFNKAKMHLELT